MSRSSRPRGFTLIELLVVVAIIALLLSILLPSLAGARAQGKRAVCLSNLSGIGKAIWQYAGEDSVESTIPIHMNMVRSVDYWLWRTANWFAWGGRSADMIFRIADEQGYFLADPNGTPPEGSIERPEYDANRRPLTLFMLGGNVEAADRKKLDWFACPSDTGYPDDLAVDDAPLANVERSCTRTLGNSYRASLLMYGLAGAAASPSNGHFSAGPWGTRISSLVDTARLVLLGEPSWFNMIGKDSGSPGLRQEEDFFGWHKRKLVDNLLFVDGSARSTKATGELDIEGSTLDQMKVYGRSLARYGDVRLDTYPVGGARIWGNWTSIIQSAGGRWPFGNFQDNLRRP